MTYKELKEKQEAEVNNFPFIYAFTKERLYKQLEGRNVFDLSEVVNLGSGCFVLRKDCEAMGAMFERHRAERQAEIDADKTGKHFVSDMFTAELINHEYTFTRRAKEALDALGYTFDDINSDKKLTAGFLHALRRLGDGI